MPKGHLRDSGILHYLLRIRDIEELYNHPIVGRSFEAFCIEEISKGLKSVLDTGFLEIFIEDDQG